MNGEQPKQQKKIKQAMRNRMRSTQTPEKHIDQKIADFFLDDPKLNKYSKVDVEQKKPFLEVTKTITSKIVHSARLYKRVLGSKARNSKPLIDKFRVTKLLAYVKQHRRLSLMGIAFISIIGLVGIFSGLQSNSDQSQVQGATSVTAEQPKPDFDVIRPNTEAVQENVAFDSEKKVASFPSTIGTANATVSQQQVSVAQATRENFLLSVAQSFGLSIETQTNKGSVFLGSNEKQRVTTAVFQTGTFLVFIRTDDIVSDSEIVEFINDLQL